LKEIEKDQPFYDNSGGGVTFSGGEPLVQWEFVLAMLKRCKERNLHTALDTTGNISWDILKSVLDYVDLVLYDLKHLDPEVHKEKTGIDNRLSLENMERLNRKARYWIRIPVIPGFNDSNEHKDKLGEFAAHLEAEKISLLPYHKWGEQKYERMGRAYSFKGVSALQDEEVEKFKQRLEAYGLEVLIGR
jgi:pyruvate formate lyase activating enzyme